jgi:hypothetical protein
MVVAGCATVDPKVIQTRLSGKSILVASTVESSLNLLWIGTTVFNNESGRLAVPDWSLNTLVVGTAIAELIETKRYRSVAIAEKIDPTKDGFVNAQKARRIFSFCWNLDSRKIEYFPPIRQYVELGCSSVACLGHSREP